MNDMIFWFFKVQSYSPNHIADSIKFIAMGQSMNDSTALFGELPRPRLNNSNKYN